MTTTVTTTTMIATCYPTVWRLINGVVCINIARSPEADAILCPGRVSYTLTTEMVPVAVANTRTRSVTTIRTNVVGRSITTPLGTLTITPDMIHI